MFNAVLTERLMRIQKAARRKIINRWKLHGTRVSCNLARLKQWYLLTLQWMKLKMCWAIPFFGDIQYSVRSWCRRPGRCVPTGWTIFQKMLEMSLSACMLGRERHVWDCIGCRFRGWEWQKEKWKQGPGWQSHPGESGCWFMAAAFSQHYPCLASSVTERGTGQGSLWLPCT